MHKVNYCNAFDHMSKRNSTQRNATQGRRGNVWNVCKFQTFPRLQGEKMQRNAMQRNAKNIKSKIGAHTRQNPKKKQF